MNALADLLGRLGDRHGVPGAQLALLTPASEQIAVYGFANCATETTVTPKTRFQIGSVTKPMLAFTAFRLAEEGRLDLDAPPAHYLPRVAKTAPLASPDLRIRHLLDHSSGLPGDLFLDLGDDLSAAGKLIKAAEEIPAQHAIGSEASYCNFGFVALGEIIAAVAGQPWPDAFRAHVVGVLGSETLDPWPHKTGPDFAVGHIAGAPAGRLHLAISNAAAGTTPVGTARDLARFGQSLLEAQLRNGPIAAANALSMTTQSARLAPNERGLGFGQGCMVMNWGGREVFGHDGLTIAQRAFLRVFPETGVSVGLLANGGDLRALYQDVFEEIAPRTGTTPPARLEPHGSGPDPSSVVGRYDRPNASLRVSHEGAGLQLEIFNHEPWAEFAYGAVEGPFPMVPYGSESCLYTPLGSDVPIMLTFGEEAAWHGMRRFNRAAVGH